MRQGFPALLFALTPYLISAPVHASGHSASSIMSIDDALFSQESKLLSTQKSIQEQHHLLEESQKQLQNLTQQMNKLDIDLQNAKSNLERQYQLVIDNPDKDISLAQREYQNAWVKFAQNTKALKDMEKTLQNQKAALTSAQAEKKAVEVAIDTLRKDKVVARVNRLREQLLRENEQKVSVTYACNSSMTLAQCKDKTHELALQKSVSQFQNWLIEQSSESKSIQQHIDNITLNVHILRNETSETGFTEENRYRVTLQTRLKAFPADNTPCTLLGLESSYCAASTNADSKSSEQEVAWVNLLIRSNQFEDQVQVDGVSYGSSPVDIMLPIGLHTVSVSKEGFRRFEQKVDIKSDQSLRAILHEQNNKLTTGHKFADTLTNDSIAPDMISIESGTYQLGEDAKQPFNLDHAFAMSATPVTVKQFKMFVEKTGYRTDSEINKVCQSINNGEITLLENKNWRTPNFSQSDQSPVVCVSQNDAKAYTHWLSQQTGFTYRLPNESEWEIAARAGSKTAYWWGEEFGIGRANTGWGGTPWSNKRTSPVRTFNPNSLGFYDVVGNIWQWTSNKQGLVKGGSWNFAPSMATAASQLYISPDNSANYVGFRVLREL